MQSNPADFISPVPPGVSWTAPDKSRPWQQPPKLPLIQMVAEYYIGVMSEPDLTDDLLDAVETQMPLASVAEAMMLNGVASGIHSLDMGILVMPVIIEMLITIAKAHNQEYVLYADDYDKKAAVSPRVARLAVKEAMKRIEKGSIDATTPTEVPVLPKGLMAKRSEVE